MPRPRAKGVDVIATRHRPAILAGVLAAAHFASFDVARQPVVTDIRYYLYFAAETFRGAVPHRDFFDNKTQLATFAGAALHGLGETLGIEPLIAIRIGYLGFAWVAGLLLFMLFRRLNGGSVTCGLLALLIYCGFPLLGVMPAIGNLPKLLMALSASLMALFVHQRRFVRAGAAGSLAFMDWQIGILAVAAACGAALADGGGRLRALGRVAVGALLGITPFALYYAAHGALAAAFSQTLAASAARGASAMATQSLASRLEHILDVIARGCGQQAWLAGVGAVGMLMFPLWIQRHTRRATRPLTVALAIYHYGLVGFCLIDFQLYGDLFILLHSVAFFAAVVVVEIYRRCRALAGRLPVSGRRRVPAAVSLGLVLLVAAAARPSFMRPPFILLTANAAARASLGDQRSVARRLEPLLDNDAPLAFVEFSEILYLTGRSNALPFIYWNAATHFHYRATPEEGYLDTWRRMTEAARPGVIGRRRLHPRLDAAFREVRVSSENGAYTAVVFVRRGPDDRSPSVDSRPGSERSDP